MTVSRWPLVVGALALALVAIAATGCGDDEPGASTADGATNGEAVKLGYINLSNQIPFIVTARKSIEAAAKKAGAELIVCDSNLDAQKAIDCARQLKTQGVQAIANYQADESAAPRVCAAGPDVPVVALDIHQPPCETVFYGADNVKAGKLAGTALGEFAKEKWNCEIDGMLSVNNPISPVVIDREKGMIDGVKSVCPDVKVTKVTSKGGTTDGTIQPFTDALTRVPGQHRLLVGATNDDQVIGAIKAAQAAGRASDIYAAGQGADKTSWPYLCGKAPFKNWIADTTYFPERYGETVVPLLIDLVKGEKKPKTVNVEHEVATQDNISKFYPDACT